MPIIENVYVVLNVNRNSVVTFPSYSAYQEWLITQTNCCNRVCLQLRISREREREAHLERLYNLPMHTLRGAFCQSSPAEVKMVLNKYAASKITFDEAIQIIKSMASPLPMLEPERVALPIRVSIEDGPEKGSIYSFATYNDYYRWRYVQASWFEKYQLHKIDKKQREVELALAAKFSKHPNYFRGILAIDYKHIFPVDYEEIMNDFALSESTLSFGRLKLKPDYDG